MDKIHVQKYIYLLTLFVSGKIDASILENLFLQIRREDSYWLSGQFNEKILTVLNAFFLDVDEYNPDDLFDPSDKFNIDQVELTKRANKALEGLSGLIGVDR